MPQATPHCLTCNVQECLLKKINRPGLLNELQPFKRITEWKRGTLLFQEGQLPKGVHFIRTGLVKLEKQGTHGRSMILKISGQGQPLGHYCMEPGDGYSSTGIAIEDSRCCFIEIDAFRRAVQQCESLRNALRSIFLKDARELETKLALMAYRQVREKIADVLLDIAGRYGYVPNGDGIKINVDRQEMADMAGTTKEQVSKTLAEFMDLGLISCRAKHFKYIDLIRLNAFRKGWPKDTNIKDLRDDGAPYLRPLRRRRKSLDGELQ